MSLSSQGAPALPPASALDPPAFARPAPPAFAPPRLEPPTLTSLAPALGAPAEPATELAARPAALPASLDVEEELEQASAEHSGSANDTPTMRSKRYKRTSFLLAESPNEHSTPARPVYSSSDLKQRDGSSRAFLLWLFHAPRLARAQRCSDSVFDQIAQHQVSDFVHEDRVVEAWRAFEQCGEHRGADGLVDDEGGGI